MAEMEHKCSKCGHTDKWKEKSDKLDNLRLNDIFHDVVLNEICAGDKKKVNAWLAKYATRYPKDFMKEWTKLQPKDMKIEKTTTLNYIKVGIGKEPVPISLPVVVEGEAMDNMENSGKDALN